MCGHLTPELLRKIANGEITKEAAIRLLLHHLGQACPKCREVFEAVAASLGSEALMGQRALSGSDLLRALEKERSRLESSAREQIRHLLASGESALQMIRQGDPETYANPVLAEVMLSDAWSACKERKPGAYALGLAIVEVGRRLAELPRYFELSFDFRLAGLTVAANAARIEDRFEVAFQLLMDADELVHEVADSGIISDFFRVLGTTHLNTHNFEDAASHFALALESAADAGDEIRLIKARLLIADLFHQQGDSHGCLAILRQARDDVSRLPETRETQHLDLVARGNLTFVMFELGDVESASNELGKIEPSLFSKFGQGARLRWLRGRLAHERAEYLEALRHLKQAHSEFTAGGFFVEAGLVLPEIAKAAQAAQKIEDLHWAGDDLVRLTDVVGDKMAEECLHLAIDEYLRQTT